MKVVVLVQLVLVLMYGPSAAHSHNQVSQSAVSDCCVQTTFNQVAMLDTLHNVGEDVKEIHTDTAHKLDDILSHVTQTHTDTVSHVTQTHTDLVSHVTQLQTDTTQKYEDILSVVKKTGTDTILSNENIITTVKRSEQLELTLLELVNKLSEDVHIMKNNSEDIKADINIQRRIFQNQSDSNTNTLVECDIELSQAKTQLNHMQVRLDERKIELEQYREELDYARTQLNNTETNLTMTLTQFNDTKIILEQDVARLEAELQNSEDSKVALVQELNHTMKELEATKVALQQSPKILEEMENCSAPFEAIPGVGCVYLSSAADGKKTWTASRQSCLHLTNNSSDLFVGHGLSVVSAARRYIDEKRGTDRVWIGMAARTWLDGEVVTSEEWAVDENEPDHAKDACGYLWTDASGYIYDFPCSYSYWYLCQRR